MDREKVFCEVLERKETFLDHKKHGLNNPQISIFPKGLVRGL